MIELANAVDKLANAVSGIGTSIIVLGILFLLFKNMGGKNE